MSYRLPEALSTTDDGPALGYLDKYFGRDGGQRYTGACFDGWGGQQEDRFTADDLVAVSFLSVFVPPLAAHRLLETEADRFSELLRDLGPDRDLVTEAEPIDADWPARRLCAALRTLHGVGPTIASKLIARKRPRLVPIYDSVVARVTDAKKSQWEPLRAELRRPLPQSDETLHDRLLRLHDKAGLESHISALRIYDVVTWMEGKAEHYEPTTTAEQLGSALAEPPAEDEDGDG